MKNQETREALRFVLKEMGERLTKLRGQRQVVADDLAKFDAEIVELERRAACIEDDLS